VFEPISQGLYELMMFCILGFLSAALYEPLRIVRLFVKTGTLMTGIQDFLFLSACGLIVFAYSLEFGAGYFRYFYVVGVVFGATVYFLTAGRLINFVMRTFANAIKTRILRPIWNLLGKIAQKIRSVIVRSYKNAEKHAKLLKNTTKIKYNSIRLKNKQQKHSKKELRNFQAREKKNGKQQAAKGVVNARTAIKARVVTRTEKA
jgi:hypothetical protein